MYNIYQNVSNLSEFIDTHPLKQPGAPGITNDEENVGDAKENTNADGDAKK